MQYLNIYRKKDILAHTKVRRFETRIGEMVQYLKDAANLEASLKASDASIVIIGAPEDIGQQANEESGGAAMAWPAFLQAFLNTQSNDFFDGTGVLLLGHFDFGEVEKLIENNAHDKEEKLAAYRHAVNTLDEAVEGIIKMVTSLKKIPVLIGGGKNNAYGCMKGAAKGWHKAGELPLAQLHAISLDAQAAYRPAEGRHSGNPFRYAEDDGYLEKYCVVGLHEGLLPQNSWLDIVNNPFFDFVTFEDIFLRHKQSFEQAVHHAIDFTSGSRCGVEADLGCISGEVTVQAGGISPLHARRYLHLAATLAKPAYVHISTAAGSNQAAGRLAADMVTDFIKALLQG